MRYLVILDVNSRNGRMYAEAGHPLVSTSKEEHPILDCLDADFTHPRLLQITHSLAHKGKTHQTLYIPYEDIVQVQRYEEKPEEPFGFAPKTKGG